MERPEPFYAVCPVREHKHRLVIFFPDPAGDNPGNAFMAAGQVYHQNPVFPQRRVYNLHHCLLHAPGSQVFSLVIELLQLHSQFPGLRFILRQEKPQGALGRIQPAAGIDAGADYKSDMVGA